MVKITIEYNGKIYQYEGDLFMGQVSSFEEGKTSAKIVLTGHGDLESIAKALEQMVVKVIQEISKDPIVVCGNLIEVHDGIDRAIRDYMKKNCDGLMGDIERAIRGEAQMDELLQNLSPLR